MLKLPHNCTHLTCYQVMLKILKARVQQYMNDELPDVQAGFRKGRGTRNQIANIQQRCILFECILLFSFISVFALHGHDSMAVHPEGVDNIVFDSCISIC